MKAPYPKAASAPAQTDIPDTPNKLSLPVGQYDDIRPFLVKRRNKEYNEYKDQVFLFHLIGGLWCIPESRLRWWIVNLEGSGRVLKRR